MCSRHKDKQDDDVDMVNAIKLRFAEYTGGYWTEKELNERLTEIYEGREYAGWTEEDWKKRRELGYEE